MARVRMSADRARGAHRSSDIGVEPIIHFTSRDRNLMAIQSDLLGAHALGIRNVIALTGDPPSAGDYARATGVWDVDSIGLIKHPQDAERRHRLGRQLDRQGHRVLRRLRREPHG